MHEICVPTQPDPPFSGFPVFPSGHEHIIPVPSPSQSAPDAQGLGVSLHCMSNSKEEKILAGPFTAYFQQSELPSRQLNHLRLSNSFNLPKLIGLFSSSAQPSDKERRIFLARISAAPCFGKPY